MIRQLGASALGCRATHLRLAENLQAVLTDELQQLAVRQAEELLFFGYLGDHRHVSTAAETENEDRACGKRKGNKRSLSLLLLTWLKCVLMYSRHQQCSSLQPISSAKRAMPMTLAGSTCLVRKSQHALATSSTWYLGEEHSKCEGTPSSSCRPEPP